MGQTVNFDIRLQAEAASAQNPAATASTSENGKIGVSTVVLQTQLDTLPMLQRRIDTLAPIGPFVAADAGESQIAILGQGSPIAFLTDGMLTRDAYFAQRPQSDPTPLDAFQGFEVLEADAPGEFGHSMTGMVNSATRSGTNDYHASAYAYLRLPSLTAVGRIRMDILCYTIAINAARISAVPY